MRNELTKVVRLNDFQIDGFPAISGPFLRISGGGGSLYCTMMVGGLCMDAFICGEDVEAQHRKTWAIKDTDSVAFKFQQHLLTRKVQQYLSETIG